MDESSIIDIDDTGIYIAYPMSPVLKSIYPPKNYKTQVNDQHTKVGKAECFKSRKKEYLTSFHNEVTFIPIARVPRKQLELAEEKILDAVHDCFKRVGRAKEWFKTTDRERIAKIIEETLSACCIPHELISQ